MAKASQATTSKGRAPTPSKGVATSPKKAEVDSVASEELLKMMAADSGKGVSTAMEDNTVPLIYILQALSPQVQKKKEEYVEGAEAGGIWFRGTKTVISGEDGIPVVPCYFTKVWIEWLPDRGGFVARHDKRPAEAVLTSDSENPKKKFWRMPNGNRVVETREHVVLVLDVFDQPRPFVIPMSGSGHKSSRDWMTLQNQKTVTLNDTTLKAPAYGYIYRMTTTFKSNDQGDWFMWQINDENGVDTMLTDVGVYTMAKRMQEDFQSGTLKAQVMDDDQVDTSADTEGGKQSEASRHI